MLRALDQPPAEILDAGQHAAGLGDRVDARLVLRAVRCASGDLDLEPGEALVRDADLERRGLGHDRGVGAHLGSDGLGADARELLVAHGRHDDIARKVEPNGLGAGPQRSGRTALHVEGAATIEAVALDARLERPLVAIVPDRVGVPVEQERAPAPAPARDTDHVGAAGSDLVDPGLGARPLEPARDEAGDLHLPRPAGHELGVDGVDRHQVGDEVSQRHGAGHAAMVIGQDAACEPHA